MNWKEWDGEIRFTPINTRNKVEIGVKHVTEGVKLCPATPLNFQLKGMEGHFSVFLVKKEHFDGEKGYFIVNDEGIVYPLHEITSEQVSSGLVYTTTLSSMKKCLEGLSNAINNPIIGEERRLGEYLRKQALQIDYKPEELPQLKVRPTPTTFQGNWANLVNRQAYKEFKGIWQKAVEAYYPLSKEFQTWVESNTTTIETKMVSPSLSKTHPANSKQDKANYLLQKSNTWIKKSGLFPTSI